jgi:glycine betaine/choline ABC-type transport system substrate-binding protein
VGVKTIPDMKKVKSFSFAGFPECRTRTTCLVGLKTKYGLTQIRFVPLMNKAVAIDKQSPAAVAKTFLQANGLLG